MTTSTEPGRIGRVVYHCHRWRGPTALLRDPASQADPRCPVPPATSRGWTAKPGSLRVHRFDAPAPALDWLWHQMRQIVTDTHQTRPEWLRPDITADHRDCRTQLHGPDAACEWLFPMPRHQAFIASIVAVYRPPEHP
ncbi:hypothetical protein LX16_4474 [Stackebrandtia albiflava]|uniref:Uncharacterized protein n=1 Tax=Stackebrandtia albiflava TaxID=406432 RepID=A0A562URK8_9ACTN|nr:hypothetical protein [Stackebrandtia albiflava]TWJ08249.1 hypothetical protein LX16_4474 [Stackebrandtia albiflava]